MYIDYLLTECEMYSGKYLPEVCMQKTRGQVISSTDRTNEVNKEFILWLLALFFIAFNETLCS